MQRHLAMQSGHAPESDAAPSLWRPIVLVFLPFASGYYLSYLFRTINALISPALVSEFSLRPADLGLLTAAYFLAFGLIQLPLGMLLDRYGPRRVQSAFLIVAAAGAALFSAATGLPGLFAGRALIGLGVAGALMAGLKAIAVWFPNERVALANGWFVMLGALGAVSATAPAELLLAEIGWRHLFGLLAATTAISAVTIFWIVPEPRSQTGTSAYRGVALSLRAIYADRRFWRLAPLSATSIGTAWALQGLWAAPWLRDVESFSHVVVVRHLFVMAIALSASALMLGLSADVLRKRGIGPQTLLAVSCAAAIGAQVALVLRLPGLTYGVWGAIGGVGAVTVLSYAILAEEFPKESIGRANGALNLLHVGYAFLSQFGIGLIVQQWPAPDGHSPAIAYQSALAINLAVQAAALLWFVRPARHATPALLAAHPIHHAAGKRPGCSPQALIGYRCAVDHWHAHVRAARCQAESWRLAALASLVVVGVLSTTLAATALSKAIVPHIIAAEVE